jgi:hypothetical protein
VTCRALPHSPQKRAIGLLLDPHAAQATVSRVPHSPQNFRPASFSVPHDEQITAPSAQPVLEE